MPRLALHLLGSFHISLDEEPVTGFESDKVRALLAYLAVESVTPHRRSTLTSLLWPEQSEKSARHNLSQALYNLRRSLSNNTTLTHTNTDYVVADNQTIQFNLASNHDVDVLAFTTLISASNQHHHQKLETCNGCLTQLRRAVNLYNGDFLAGFGIRDSSPFEEWRTLTQERLHRQMVTTLQQLSDSYEVRGAFEEALPFAQQQIEMERWREEFYRQLMRLLASCGRSSEALAQYERCRHILAQEFDIELSEATKRLYEQILQGTRQTVQRTHPPHLPSFLAAQSSPVAVDHPSFVARETELAQLETHLGIALSGATRFAFVSGDAGDGKTALIDAFINRSQAKYPDLLVLKDSCNAYNGIGDPYLPFRTALELLTGNIESRYAAGTISHEYARQLWHAMPFTVQTVVDAGPDLIGTFIAGTSLWNRMSASAAQDEGWLLNLETLVQPRSLVEGERVQQQALFEQYTSVLQTVSKSYPLLLFVDDLQWADPGSISLLFHLGRRLSHSRVLLIGAYRTEEIVVENTGERHPLAPVLHEFQRNFDDVIINLDHSDGMGFVEKLIDLEPNRLGVEFRQTLYRQTTGRPLFTIELLRDMQDRGDLVRDDTDHWREGPSLAWEILPAKIEAVIAERIDRLPRSLATLLTVASVEGEEFTAEVIARVQGIDERTSVEQLETGLVKEHRLVYPQDIQRVKERRISRYRFRHHLFQRYLYTKLNDAQRAYFHEDVGLALEALYASDPDQLAAIASTLARHFREAGNYHKALHYLQRAGERAMILSAHEEAIKHFTEAVTLVALLPHSTQRDQQELTIQLRLAGQFMVTYGHSAPETADVHAHVRKLSLQVDNNTHTHEYLSTLYMLWAYYLVQADMPVTRELAKELNQLRESTHDAAFHLTGHWAQGVTLLHCGELTAARTHLEQMIALYDPHEHGELAFLHALDPKATGLFWLARTLWNLGYAKQARQQGRKAVAHARTIAHPHTLVVALSNLAWVYLLCGQGQMAKQSAAEAIAVSVKYGIPQLQGLATILYGSSLVAGGDTATGLAELNQGFAIHRETGSHLGDPYFLCTQATIYGSLGDPVRGLQIIAEAMTNAQQSDESLWDAELYRVKGELLLQQRTDATELGDDAVRCANCCLLQAITVAQQQEARSLELRATISLAQLLQHQGKPEEARERLTTIYEWFTEGFDTADLRKAKALLQTLA